MGEGARGLRGEARTVEEPACADKDGSTGAVTLEQVT